MTTSRQSPTLRRRRLSDEIRRLREEANMTAAQVAKDLSWAVGKLTKMERREWVRPNPRDIRDLCDLYGADPAKRQELETLAKEGRERGWWHPYSKMVSQAYSTYIGFEAGAAQLHVFEPMVIHGLLQTEEYARAIVAGGPNELSEEQIEQRVKIRAERQELLTREDDPLRLWVVMDEAALRRQVGGPEVTRLQLRHLLELSKLAKVTLQVTPYSTGAHPGVMGGFTILSFPEPEDLDAVYIETAAGQLFVEEPEEVSRFQIALQRLQAMALTPADSLRMIDDLSA